jgi:hypothetical protein
MINLIDSDLRTFAQEQTMNVEIRWEDEARTLIRHTYSGVWNWDDFYSVLEQRPADLRIGGGIPMIIDVRGVTSFPSDMILHLREAAKMAEITDDLIIVIANSSTLATLFHLFVRVYNRIGRRLRLVNTEAEAYALLHMPVTKQPMY